MNYKDFKILYVYLLFLSLVLSCAVEKFYKKCITDYLPPCCNPIVLQDHAILWLHQPCSFNPQFEDMKHKPGKIVESEHPPIPCMIAFNL